MVESSAPTFHVNWAYAYAYAKRIIFFFKSIFKMEQIGQNPRQSQVIFARPPGVTVEQKLCGNDPFAGGGV